MKFRYNGQHINGYWIISNLPCNTKIKSVTNVFINFY